MAERALHGLRVVELSDTIAGAYCGKLLAGFGAEVVKVEPPDGDSVRHRGPFAGDRPNLSRSRSVSITPP